MKTFRIKFLVSALVLLLLVGFGYYYKDTLGRFVRGTLNQLQPCQRPITYSIVTIDPRFDLSKTALLSDIQKAEKIWESPINKQLFEYSTTGDVKINLIYDYRQKATDAMRKIGIVINDDRSTYDALKIKYDTFIVSYSSKKAQIDALVTKYNAESNAFESSVNYWNKRGGAPKAEYNILEQKRIDLNNQVTTINQAKDSLNELVDTINSTETILNKLITTLNLHVNTYNTVGASTGKEFNEGEYISGASGTIINIYQYNDTNQLVRVLAHELGHALGLDHLENPKAIMYYLNEGVNEKLTIDDLAALKNRCQIP